MSVHYEKDGAVARFTFDNGKLNVLNVEMHKQLCEYLSDFLMDDDLKVGILAGAQGRSFCGGDDLRSEPRPINSVPNWPHLVSTMKRNKPIIAAVDQWCLGQGFVYLMLLTDIRIATAEAKFGLPEINYGMGGAGGVTRLGRHLPPTVAMYMLLTGEYMDANLALKHDLINEIVPQDNLLERAETIAAKITRHPLLGIQTEMDAYTAGNDLSKADAVNLAASLYRYQRKIHEATHGGPENIQFNGLTRMGSDRD